MGQTTYPSLPHLSPGPAAWAGSAGRLPPLLLLPSITHTRPCPHWMLLAFFSLPSSVPPALLSLSCSFCLSLISSDLLYPLPPKEPDRGLWPGLGLRKRALYRAVSPQHPSPGVRNPPPLQDAQLLQPLFAWKWTDLKGSGVWPCGWGSSSPCDLMLGSGQVAPPMPSPPAPGTQRHQNTFIK